MLIGVVGAPNKGKSTFFSAATMVDAAIANYPFTTVSPNRGVTYVRSPCPHVQLGLPECNPKNSKCVNGTRLVPVGMIDVPGLVPDAHKGKGLGNKFLDSIREADALILVVDGSGRTDLQGNACDDCPPIGDVEFLKNEISMWLASIMLRHKTRGKEGMASVVEALSGLKIDSAMVAKAADRCGLDIEDGLPDEGGVAKLAREIIEMRLPLATTCNKMDLPCAEENFERMRKELGEGVFACSAAVELALRKAADSGIIDYCPGESGFRIVGEPNPKQREALEKMAAFIGKNHGSGVQKTIDWLVYKKLDGMVVYPVEDEHKCANHKGEVLPDALLVPRTTTAVQLAGKVHTELAQKFIGAIDVKGKIRIGADHQLKDGDVVKIIASR